MFVNYRGSIIGLVRWQWRITLFLVLTSTAVVLLESRLGLTGFVLPALPVGVVGGAIGIFVSFRTNSCYDRWWEGRKLWGRLINTSRHFCTQVLSMLPRADDGGLSELQRALVRRHIAYVHALRVGLRGQSLKNDAELQTFLDEGERETIPGESNANHALLQRQSEELTRLADDGSLDELRLQRFDDSIRHLLDIQGGCERIKKTPFPRGYGFIAERLIWAYGVLLPLGLVEALGWMTVPITVLVCLAFALISEVGRVLEDPFTMFWPALPLSALAKTIEINLRQRLGETELPAMPAPNEKGILM
jgi:putative membrane protein